MADLVAGQGEEILGGTEGRAKCHTQPLGRQASSEVIHYESWEKCVLGCLGGKGQLATFSRLGC